MKTHIEPAPGGGSKVEVVGAGDLAQVCRILAGQAVVLDQMFRRLGELASQEETDPETAQRLSRLALRAQAQTNRVGTVLGRLFEATSPELRAERAALQARKKGAPMSEPVRAPEPHPLPGNSDDRDGMIAEFFELATESRTMKKEMEQALQKLLTWPEDPETGRLMRPARVAA